MAVIDIKGRNNTLMLVFHQGSAEEYRNYLTEKFAASPQLFSGIPVVFSGEGVGRLTAPELAMLQQLCLDHGLLLGNVETKVRKAERAVPRDLFVHRTLRSGQSVRSEGSVVIFGNVNESAEVFAGRDIVVLGKLEGIAHAGCYGDTDRIILALNLYPPQIRIGDLVSSCPSGYTRSKEPEVAFVEDGKIYIDRYDPALIATRLHRYLADQNVSLR